MGNPFLFTILIQKLLTIVFLQVSAGILFSSYPCFSFYLGCLFGLPSAISCRNPHIEYGRTSYICQYHDCLEFGNLWFFFDVKCSQKLVSLGYHGKPISFHNSDPKVIDECFFSGIRWHSLLFLPLLFLFSWIFLWAAISYQLQKPIHRIWMSILYVSIGNWGGPIVNLKLHFFNVKCSKKLINFENPFLSTIQIQMWLTFS